MSDRPERERPVREQDEPQEPDSERVGVYETPASTDPSRTGMPGDTAPESVGVYDRPASADRRTPPAIMALVVLVVLAVLALLALTLIF